MPRRVKGPDGVVRSFPDDATDDEISAALGAQARKPAAAEDFMRPEDIANRDNGTSIAAGIGTGILKGAGRSLMGLGEMAAAGGMIPGVHATQANPFNPAMRHPLFTRAEESLASRNDAETLGGRVEMAAELAAPVRALASGAVSLGRKALTSAGPALMRAATSETSLLTQARQLAARKILGKVLDFAKPAADDAAAAVAPTAAPVVNPNAGGRVVPRQALSIEDEIASALDELRAPAQAPVQLPPPVTTAPSATPRTSAPRPAAPRPQAAAPAPQPQGLADIGAPAPPKRAYFLKPADELAAVAAEPVRPLGRPVTVDDLPASWRSRTGQNPGEIKGIEGRVVAEAFADELAARGMSAGEAMAAVAKNPSLTPGDRLKIMAALTKVRKVAR